jgi:hypothetical protein
MTKGHYTPRKKKKLSGPSLCGKMKLVRIDNKTEVEVPAGVSDADAIERYYNRHKTATRPPIGVETQDEIDIIQADLAEVVIDDSVPVLDDED